MLKELTKRVFPWSLTNQVIIGDPYIYTNTQLNSTAHYLSN